MILRPCFRPTDWKISPPFMVAVKSRFDDFSKFSLALEEASNSAHCFDRVEKFVSTGHRSPFVPSRRRGLYCSMLRCGYDGEEDVFSRL